MDIRISPATGPTTASRRSSAHQNSGTKNSSHPKKPHRYFKQRLDRLNGQAKDDIHYDDALWQAETYAKQPNLRTSIVFDPPDGRLPPLTAEAQRRDAERREAAAAGDPPTARRAGRSANVHFMGERGAADAAADL